ncbi:hypothetical protein E6O75_ATG01467 [Venturia nashicola]|uniref:Uncharacterized protein n=1 Tax=Venturia nashicola TaxID=86259 RepID=A0A4Z1PH19_9PEZI|nr:hypothetical protein E6O75_ATG01467 [Venturia nashicola]
MIPPNITPLLPAPTTGRQFPLSFDALAIFLVRVLAVAEFPGFVVVEAEAADPGAVRGAAFSGAGGGGHFVVIFGEEGGGEVDVDVAFGLFEGVEWDVWIFPIGGYEELSFGLLLLLRLDGNSSLQHDVTRDSTLEDICSVKENKRQVEACPSNATLKISAAPSRLLIFVYLA